ncbi:MAG: phospholipase D-like domain-containing protein [Bacteroidales bacterium]|jgi:hypothetical protein
MNEIIIKNPLTDWIQNSIINSKERLNFAVPFLSSFANTLLNEQTVTKIADKRLITRFDDSNLNSFDLLALKALLDLNFTIQFDNSIHLKLYITDNDAYVTSSNLTKGGFESNVELTVKTDSSNTQKCVDIFNEIWSTCSDNKVTYELINSNWAKYKVLQKREKFNKKGIIESKIKPIKVGEFDLQKIIDAIFDQNVVDYSKIKKIVFEANKLREKTKKKLMQGYNSLIFYAPEGHELRRENLFYDFVYGYEYDLAGTGLREAQFKTAFEHPNFENVVNYIYPDMLGMKSWNLNDKDEFQEFCNGIFDFDIPQYSEVLPIRLASYFYPDFFIPLFRIEHLKKVCEILGLETDAETRGDRLFVYNLFLTDKMKSLPFDNYTKSEIAYLLIFTVELYNRLNKGEKYQDVLNSNKKKWEKSLIERGKDILIKLKMIE